jgi:uroporphyrinogen-III decarboxylase
VDIVDVKKKYGDKFAVWGGVQVENFVSGTTEDIRKDVRRVMNAFKGQSGFILGDSHSIATGKKYENFMA